MKRAISIFLIFVLCLSFLPVFASAEEEVAISASLEISENTVKGFVEFTDNSTVPLEFYDAIAVLSFINYDKTTGKEVISSQKSLKFDGRKAKIEISSIIPGNAENVELNVYDNTTDRTPLCEKKWRRVSKSLKILSIGNSFSYDSLRYLYQIAEDAGYTDIKIGFMFIGGCPISKHWANASNDVAGYTYYKNYNGKWYSEVGKTLEYGIVQQDWDFISMQQAIEQSTTDSEYENLANLVNYVESKKTNPNAKLIWNMTWNFPLPSATTTTTNWYAKKFSDGTLMYGSTPQEHYGKIVDMTEKYVLPLKKFDYIVPSATTVQNAKSSYIGDAALYRDGRHLSMPFGSYAVGLTWISALTGISPLDISYFKETDSFNNKIGTDPETGKDITETITTTITEKDAKMAKYAAEMAIKKPFEETALTDSSIFEEPFNVEADISIEVTDTKVKGTVKLDDKSYIAGMKYNPYIVMTFYNHDRTINSTKIADTSALTFKGRHAEVKLDADIPQNVETVKLMAYDSANNLKPIGNYAWRRLDKTLRIFSIGNSFSQDSLQQYAYEIAKSLGYETVEIGFMFIGGAYIDKHVDFALNNTAEYGFYWTLNGNWSSRAGKTIYDGLTYRNWDIISFQQASDYSTTPESYDKLAQLVEYVDKNKTNPNAKYAWHMTWSYPEKGETTTKNYYSQSYVNASGELKFGASPYEMLDKIMDVAREKVFPLNRFDYLVPTGTAVMNARSSYLEDVDLYRDDRHLSKDVGRYLAALTWIQSLTGVNACDIDYSVTSHTVSNVEYTISDEDLEMIKLAAGLAQKKPFTVTDISKLYAEPEITLEDALLEFGECTVYYTMTAK